MPQYIRINPETVAHHLIVAAERYEDNIKALNAEALRTPSMAKTYRELAEQFQRQAGQAREMAAGMGSATHFTLDGDVLVAHV